MRWSCVFIIWNLIPWLWIITLRQTIIVMFIIIKVIFSYFISFHEVNICYFCWKIREGDKCVPNSLISNNSCWWCRVDVPCNYWLFMNSWMGIINARQQNNRMLDRRFPELLMPMDTVIMMKRGDDAYFCVVCVAWPHLIVSGHIQKYLMILLQITLESFITWIFLQFSLLTVNLFLEKRFHFYFWLLMRSWDAVVDDDQEVPIMMINSIMLLTLMRTWRKCYFTII